MTTAIYIRTKNSDTTSLAKEFALNNNLKINYFYQDLNVSGINSYYQTQRHELMDNLDKIDTLIVNNLKELAIDTYELKRIKSTLKENGVKLITCC